MEGYEVLKIANFAGKLILENGGETYRVEDTVCKICGSFGYKASCFATITGITSTLEDEYGKPISVIERVRKRTIDLDKIHRINSLTRNVRKYNEKKFILKLIKINNRKRYTRKKTLLASCLVAGSFAGMFGGGPMEMALAFVIGGILYQVETFFSRYDLNPYLMYITCGSFASAISYIGSVTNLITNTNVVTVASIMLLVPGIAITNAIRDLIAGDLVAGVTRGVEALIVASCLAIGSGVILAGILKLGGSI